MANAEGLGFELTVAAGDPDPSLGDSAKEIGTGVPFGKPNGGYRRGPEPGIYDVAEVDARALTFLEPSTGHFGHRGMPLPTILDTFLTDGVELKVERVHERE